MADSNITYVSYIVYSPDDRFPIEKRIEWMKPLLNLDINLILFADNAYMQKLPPTRNKTKVVPLNIGTLSTFKQIRRVHPIHLPPSRNEKKDTLGFIALMNCKPEIMHLAKPYVLTPYMAYIDAGLCKVFSKPDTVKRLEKLKVKNVPLLLIPGCSPIQQVEAFPFLWKGIHWMLSGGFFIMPKTHVDEFYKLHTTALQKYLDMNSITWEVNVWASFAHEHKDRIIWYYGDHDDRMITSIPTQNILL
jgi:hypothetical protein